MRKVQIVLASPGDVASERNKLRETILSNVNLWAKFSKIEFVPIDWEHNTYPAIADYSQDAINSQFGDDYEILTAIFWYKVGTPTPKHPSGTVEEVERAISRNKSNGSVNLQLYFKTKEIPESAKQQSQQSELYALRKEWSERGVYYWEFEEQTELVELIFRHLALWVEQTYFIKDNTDKDSKVYLESQPKELLSAVEYMQTFNDDSEVHTQVFREMSALISENAESTHKENAVLHALIKLPKSKSTAAKITKQLRENEFRRKHYANKLKPKIIEAKTIFVKRFDLYSAALLAASIGGKGEKRMMRDISEQLPPLVESYRDVLGAANDNIESSSVIAKQWSKTSLGKTEQKLVDIYVLLANTMEDYIRVLIETKKTSDELLERKSKFKLWNR